MIGILGLDLLFGVITHGWSRKQNAWMKFADTALMLFMLWWGGFWK